MGQAKQSTNATTEAQKKFFELLAKFDNAVLVTHSEGKPDLHARPMAIADVDKEGGVWFITGLNTPKIHELERDAHVLAVMQDGRQWLSIQGTAGLHRERTRIHQVWKEGFRAWFDGKDDPNIVLIRVNPYEAEYWDNSGLSGLKFALQFAKAYVSGKELQGPNDVDVHAKVQL